jgi:hypothetical protein
MKVVLGEIVSKIEFNKTRKCLVIVAEIWHYVQKLVLYSCNL